jgi:hypothetical protein
MGCGTPNPKTHPTSSPYISCFSEFYEELEKGRKLLIYEDFVLDITELLNKRSADFKLLNTIAGK